MPTFDIIIISWNRLDYLKRTIASLMQSNAWKDAERIIIVDNCSTEKGVHEFLEEMRKLHGVALILRTRNDGWARSVNDALGLSRAEFVFVCNNDVENFKLDFHKDIFLTFANVPNIGILGVWRHINHGEVKNGISNEWFTEMDNVPAVGWMIDKKAMEKIGMLRENGICLTKGGNGEDTDYVNRMKQAGYLVGVPKVDLAIHIDGYQNE